MDLYQTGDVDNLWSQKMKVKPTCQTIASSIWLFFYLLPGQKSWSSVKLEEILHKLS